MTRPRDLPPELGLRPEERAFFRAGRSARRREAPPFAVTRHLLALMDPADPGDPIRRQFLPTAAELSPAAGELEDPLGEREVEPVPGLLHRYPDRALLLVTGRCAAYCRHCFRRRSPGRRRAFLGRAGLERAAAYLAAHPEVRELILSGGDPLLLSDARLRAVFTLFRRRRPGLALRLHTRLPVVQPRRVTPALAGLLAAFAPLRLAVQVNHPRELAPTCRQALGLLTAAGVPLLSQSVLLAGVNDSAETLAALFAALGRAGVRPYYLFQPDLARGTAHFRPAPARGLELYRAAAALCPAAPRYMLDLPGGGGKVPVDPELLREREGEMHLLRRGGGLTAARYPAGEGCPAFPSGPRGGMLEA